MNRFPRRLTRRDLLRTGGLALGLSLLAACAPPAPQSEESEPVVDAAQPVVETQPPTAAAVEKQPATATTPVQAADRPFSPSDPDAFVLAAGRPQLVEFYATW